MIAMFDNIEPLRYADIKGVEASEKGPYSFGTFERQAFKRSEVSVTLLRHFSDIFTLLSD